MTCARPSCGHSILGHCLGVDLDGGVTRCLTCDCPALVPPMTVARATMKAEGGDHDAHG